MDTKREHRTHAEGSPRGNPYDLTYSPSGRLIGKYRDNRSVTMSVSADMAYGYCDNYQPHAVKRMFDYKSGTLYDLRWDDAGNLGQVSIAKPGEMFETGRFLFWTEDNRMHAAVDDRYYSYYAYDHSGERRLKLTGDNKLLDVNADFMATYTILNEPTLYPSAYMVLTNKGYTNVAKAESRASSLALPRRSSVTVRKHYYAGTERVAARMGGGGLDALYHAIGNNNTIQTKANLLFDQSLEQVNHRVLHENDLDCIMHNDFAKEEFGHWIDGIPYQMQAGVEFDHSQFKDMVNSMLDDINHGQEKEVYFYHSDHLGSASWITDFSGVAVQHIQYLPYGEPYIDQRAAGTTYRERFRFTGKERDEETGYGYFGARYMDHELMTMWLSVDPMADKYPSISPYAYCAWNRPTGGHEHRLIKSNLVNNPVRLVDPDGREIDVSGLSEAMQQRLVNCLGKITGLNLKVENGLLISIGKDPNNTSYSQSAQDDLLAAISNKEIKVAAQESDEYDDTYGGDRATIEDHDIYISSSLHAGNEDYDAKTEGLGMSFLHELGHAYFGDIDPAPDPDSFIERTFDKRQPYLCCGVDLGGAVSRVNKYRTEMGMPLRVSYESYSYRKGEPESWRKFEGQVAFREGNSIVYKTMR